MPVYVCRWPNGDCSVVLAREQCVDRCSDAMLVGCSLDANGQTRSSYHGRSPQAEHRLWHNGGD